jgi:hypothetical protein
VTPAKERQTALTCRVEQLCLYDLIPGHNIMLVHPGFSCTSHGFEGRRRRLHPSDQVDQGTFTSACFPNYENIACIYATQSFLDLICGLI